MKVVKLTLIIVIGMFAVGCDGTPPPAPPIKTAEKIGERPGESGAPRRVTIMPLRTSGSSGSDSNR